MVCPAPSILPARSGCPPRSRMSLRLRGRRGCPLGTVTATQIGGLAVAVTVRGTRQLEAGPASKRSTLIGIIASRMRQDRRNKSDTTVDFRRNYGNQRSRRTSVASMLASAQKSGKAHTNATEFRENRLAITENTEKKDVYLSPLHVNQLMAYEDRLFRSILRNMSS